MLTLLVPNLTFPLAVWKFSRPCNTVSWLRAHMKLALRALRDSVFICRLMKPVSIHRILKMLPFMKSKEFVNCLFFEALDEIAVTRCQPGVLRLIILTSDVGFPHFLMKKSTLLLAECIPLVITALVFRLQKHSLKPPDV